MARPRLPRVTWACLCCGKEMEGLESLARVQRYCSRACASTGKVRPPGAGRKKGQVGPQIDWACQYCGKLEKMPPSVAAKRKTCSYACASRLAHGTPMNNCPNCGDEFAAKLTGGIRMQHCSRKCSEQARRKAREIVEAPKRIAAALVRITAETPFTFRPAVAGGFCEGCGIGLVVQVTAGGRCSTCTSCRLTSIRQQRRKQKAKRRALTRGAVAQPIDPLAVFVRDKWRCHICGRKTPKSKRGTYDDDAPELDHVITLAEGGSHTWGNVACSCRKCNGMKGAKSLGQIGLPFAA